MFPLRNLIRQNDPFVLVFFQRHGKLVSGRLRFLVGFDSVVYGLVFLFNLDKAVAHLLARFDIFKLALSIHDGVAFGNYVLTAWNFE